MLFSTSTFQIQLVYGLLYSFALEGNARSGCFSMRKTLGTPWENYFEFSEKI